MNDLYKFIGEKISELRRGYGATGISQEALAREMGTTANTISRWESATYKPSAKDLHNLATFFGVGISVFFPAAENAQLLALMSATGDLRPEEIDELIEYAQFRKARRTLKKEGMKKKRHG
jgi:transcriptional regulator with XRE-family HTH domain